MKRISVFMLMVALIGGMVPSMVGCGGTSTEYTLSVSCTVGGNVTNPGIGTFTYPAGAVVLLEVEPGEGYGFTHWSGNVSTIADVNSATTSITMNGHYLITANFAYGQLIQTWYDLDDMRNDLGGYYILMNDLDATTPGYDELASDVANEGKGWQSIGIYEPSTPFTGTFDGQGYEIRDLFANRPDELGVGLFSELDGGGTIENIGVLNCNLTGRQDVACLVGAALNGTVTNCYSSGSITGEHSVAGLAGANLGTVCNSYFTGSVTGLYAVGGLVGWNFGSVDNSYSTCKVTGDAAVGGLVGWNWGGTVSNSYSTGDVTGNGAVGGLVGYNIDDSFVSDSYSTGRVTGNTGVGGMVGANEVSTVSNSYATGAVSRSSGEYTDFGGFVGMNSQGNITKCYSTGSVQYENTDDPTDKGFAGNVTTGGDYEMTGNFWDTETSGQTSTAGNATGKTTAEMKDINTFSGATWEIVAVANPDIRNLYYIWNIVDGETYPFLSWEP